MSTISFYDEEEFDVLTITYEDGEEEECIVLGITTVEGFPGQYAALMPVDEVEKEDADVYLYRYGEDEEGNPVLEEIDNSVEMDFAIEAFDELFDEGE